jgi:hypothetical protein
VATRSRLEVVEAEADVYAPYVVYVDLDLDVGLLLLLLELELEQRVLILLLEQLERRVLVLVLILPLAERKEDRLGNIVVVILPFAGNTVAWCWVILLSSNEGVAKEEAVFQVVAREIKARSSMLLLLPLLLPEGSRSLTDGIDVSVSPVVMVGMVWS